MTTYPKLTLMIALKSKSSPHLMQKLEILANTSFFNDLCGSILNNVHRQKHSLPE